MQFHVESDGHLPVHNQLREQIRFLILNGDLAAGSRLPTTRQLAGFLRINRNTVGRAYREPVRSDQHSIVINYHTLDEAAMASRVRWSPTSTLRGNPGGVPCL